MTSKPPPSTFIWERVGAHPEISRAKVPGGWLVVFRSGSGGGLTFVPDSEHHWDGKTLP
jgi:hypothetical protein